jgi:hypothetical protein
MKDAKNITGATELRKKYRPVLELVRDYSKSGANVWEDDDMLHIRATVDTAYGRDVIREKIEELAGDVPRDLDAIIQIRNDLTREEESKDASRNTERLANRRPIS